jgi:hypothetical protein
MTEVLEDDQLLEREMWICRSVGAVLKILEWVSGVLDNEVAVWHDQSFKTLHDCKCECYRAVVIVAGSLRVLGNRNYGGQFEMWG